MGSENRRMFRQFNIVSDAVILFLTLPLAYWFRFCLLRDGVVSVPFNNYLALNVVLVLAHLLVFAFLGLLDPPERFRVPQEAVRLLLAEILIAGALLSALFISHEVYYSRVALGIYFLISGLLLGAKRLLQRQILRSFRRKGHGRKNVLVIGSGKTAATYLAKIKSQRHLGYHPIGYVAETASASGMDLTFLGGFAALDEILASRQPDEIVCAIDADDYSRMPEIIAACEKSGIKLSIVPFYAEYLTSVTQFENICGMPMLNVRKIPLDTWGNAFMKRLTDILGSLVLILITAPVMLICAIGVRISSPGPILFKQERVGRNNKLFSMYKFRSMRMNNEQNTRWSTDSDERKTAFGAFLRKYSLDELPQFFNVLRGDMSLVGPRPELPHFVHQFKEEVPLYMVKHQVRPGITGWAQVCGFRGDTSIKERIEHDIDYIEHWTLSFDLKILFITVFKGKFRNSERLH